METKVRLSPSIRQGPDAILVVMRITRLLGVWAHPDDEAYLSAGLMGRVVRSGGHVTCVTATRGEAGGTSGRVRERELRASLAASGVYSRQILGHPDGACAAVPHERAVRQIERVIHSLRPDVIVTFGPEGITGHPDHIAVHRWVTDAWRRTRRGELLYAVHTEDFLERHREMHERIGVFIGDEPEGWPELDVSLAVDLDDDELRTKRAALAAHASQTDALALAIGEAEYRNWIRRETFRAAVPRAQVTSSSASMPAAR